MHVVLAQQCQRLIHGGRPIQQQADGGGGGDVGLVGLLVGGLGVDEQHSHRQALLVQAVQRDIGGGQGEQAVQQAGGQLVLPKADVGQVNHGDGAVAVLRGSADKEGGGVVHVKVAAEDGVALRGLGGKGGAAQIRDVEAQGETLEQLLHQEVQQLVVVGGTALGQKVVQAVVSQIGHGEQVGVVHPLNGVQGAQLGLEQGQQHQYGGENHRRQGEQGPPNVFPGAAGALGRGLVHG
ncbi:Uncharacterised protein [Flavonifractor plautii]|nr:Uncharacterised protein [Flavonifractor plautii]